MVSHCEKTAGSFGHSSRSKLETFRHSQEQRTRTEEETMKEMLYLKPGKKSKAGR
jgi:hypothetical protein